MPSAARAPAPLVPPADPVAPLLLSAHPHRALQQGRVYIAITSKGYPSRYIYSSPDGASRGVLGVLKKEMCVWASGASSLHEEAPLF